MFVPGIAGRPPPELQASGFRLRSRRATPECLEWKTAPTALYVFRRDAARIKSSDRSNLAPLTVYDRDPDNVPGRPPVTFMNGWLEEKTRERGQPRLENERSAGRPRARRRAFFRRTARKDSAWQSGILSCSSPERRSRRLQVVDVVRQSAAQCCRLLLPPLRGSCIPRKRKQAPMSSSPSEACCKRVPVMESRSLIQIAVDASEVKSPSGEHAAHHRSDRTAAPARRRTERPDLALHIHAGARQFPLAVQTTGDGTYAPLPLRPATTQSVCLSLLAAGASPCDSSSSL